MGGHTQSPSTPPWSQWPSTFTPWCVPSRDPLVQGRRLERSPQGARCRTSPCGSRLHRTVRRITKLDASDTILRTTVTKMESHWTALQDCTQRHRHSRAVVCVLLDRTRGVQIRDGNTLSLTRFNYEREGASRQRQRQASSNRSTPPLVVKVRHTSHIPHP